MPLSLDEQLQKNRTLILRFLAPTLWVLGPGVFSFSAHRGSFASPIPYLALFLMWFASGLLVFSEYSQIFSKKKFFFLLIVGFIIQVFGFSLFFIGASSFAQRGFLDGISFLPVLGIPQLVVTCILFILSFFCKKSPRFFSFIRISAIGIFVLALIGLFISYSYEVDFYADF